MLSEDYLIEQLNAPTRQERLMAVTGLKKLMDDGFLEKPLQGEDINNHIHTTYSFSPYSPSKAVWRAYTAGLCTAGIMDHDSIGGAEEFIEAGKIVGLPTTIGMEMRVDFSNTPLNGRRINNPDQDSIAYMAVHGIPHTQLDKIRDFFTPYSAKRIERDRKMLANINSIMRPHGITLDFDKDVLPLSEYKEGGSVTERHLLFALSKKLVEKFGKGPALAELLERDIKLELSSKNRQRLEQTDNPYYEYDLLGALKSGMVADFYIDADEECPDVSQVAELARQTGAILAYAYLGDVTDSVTGDKKAQKFEDDYLDLLFETLKKTGFNAVTYMPSRNTLQQLRRVRSKCDEYGLFQISGEDINSPRQSFICMAQREPEFSNLYDAAWALIGHEIAATEDIQNGFCSDRTVRAYPALSDRIEHFKNIALDKYH